MKREDLFLALSDIDERFIEETARDMQRGRRRVQPWMLRVGALAACVALVVMLPVGTMLFHPMKGSSPIKGVGFSGGVQESAVQEEHAESQPAEDMGDSLSGAVNDEVVNEEAPEAQEESYGAGYYHPDGTVIFKPTAVSGSEDDSPFEVGTVYLNPDIPLTVAAEKETEEEYFLRLQILLIREDTALEADSEEFYDVLHRFVDEGYHVGLTEYLSENGPLTAGAGYFSPEDVERLETAPPALEDYTVVLYFGSEEFQREDTPLYLAE